MRRRSLKPFLTLLVLALPLLAARRAPAEPHPTFAINATATNFSLPGSYGRTYTLVLSPSDPQNTRRTIVDIPRSYFSAPSIRTQTVATETPVEQSTVPQPDAEGWYSLFDGKTLDGWKAAETPSSFKVEDGLIVCGGNDRGHLFYEGPVHNHDFKDFHLQFEFKTQPGSNSGVFFHTEYQDFDWPAKGHEAQVNNSFKADPRSTGSLYGVKDVLERPFKDDVWNKYDITVHGRHVTLAVNGKTMVDYDEPDPAPVFDDRPGRKLSHGTIALQAHDPGSIVRYRNIRIKPLD